MSGFLTTHVLDTARGCPAVGMRIDLFKIDGETRALVRSLTTNADGRTDSQILPAAEFTTGTFARVFFAGDHFDAIGMELAEPKFFDPILLCIGMSDARHYHVPLLLSPFSFSTYCGC